MSQANAPTALLPAHRPRREGNPWVTAVVWVLVLALVATGVTFGFGLHRGDPEGATRLANAEIATMLDRGEVVVARAPVAQRMWWDYYRHTYGVLAATDRRLLYVGVPPEPLLRRDDGPPELLTQSWPYNRTPVVSRVSLWRGTRPGLRLAQGTALDTYGYTPADARRVDTVVAVMDRALAALRAAADAERRATEAAEAASRRPITHLVQPGEALEFIARRYGVPVDSLVAWNALPTPRIRAGQRLLVRPGQ